MRVLVAHNFYQQPGGEDQVFRSELALLESRGISVARFEMHNDDVGRLGRLRLAGATLWHRAAADRLRDACRAHRADVVHFHNTFPLMSPSCYAAARAEGAAVVQTLHNFRLLCAGACFYRDGNVCEKCLGKSVPLAGVVNKCYRGSAAASLVTAAMTTIHRAVGTWTNAVDAYITPTTFARDKFVAGGLPAEKIFVKPNFLDPDPGPAPDDCDAHDQLTTAAQSGAQRSAGPRRFAVFVGRLSPEKGVDVLLRAWSQLQASVDAMPLRIIGDGPLADDVRRAAEANPAVEWLGRRTPEEVLDHVGRAAVLIFPSTCYETFGRAAIEAFARATPVIASNHGAPADVVEHGVTGLRFTPGDATDLAAKVRQFAADPSAARRMRRAARAEYLAKYTGDRNFAALMEIYKAARATRPRPNEEALDAEPLMANG